MLPLAATNGSGGNALKTMSGRQLSRTEFMGRAAPSAGNKRRSGHNVNWTIPKLVIKVKDFVTNVWCFTNERRNGFKYTRHSYG
jgi:hypothetical protein